MDQIPFPQPSRRVCQKQFDPQVSRSWGYPMSSRLDHQSMDYNVEGLHPVLQIEEKSRLDWLLERPILLKSRQRVTNLDTQPWHSPPGRKCQPCLRRLRTFLWLRQEIRSQRIEEPFRTSVPEPITLEYS